MGCPPLVRLDWLSDGLDEKRLSFEEFMDRVGSAPRNRSALPQIRDTIRVENGTKTFGDDLSNVEVTF